MFLHQKQFALLKCIFKLTFFYSFLQYSLGFSLSYVKTFSNVSWNLALKQWLRKFAIIRIFPSLRFLNTANNKISIVLNNIFGCLVRSILFYNGSLSFHCFFVQFVYSIGFHIVKSSPLFFSTSWNRSITYHIIEKASLRNCTSYQKSLSIFTSSIA